MRLAQLKNNNQGFTLIEAMICILLVSVALLAITRMQVGSIRGNQLAMEIMDASLLSSSAADNLLGRGYSDAMLTVPDGVAQNLPAVGKYTTQYTITTVPFSSTETYKSIDVNTSWAEFGQTHQVDRMIIKLPNF